MKLTMNEVEALSLVVERSKRHSERAFTLNDAIEIMEATY